MLKEASITITLDLRPEAEANLAARARATGLSLESFIESVLECEAAVADTNGCPSLTGAEKAGAFRTWAKSFPADLPVLSLEDVSRESIYRRD
jgi:hypothetical protein